MKSRRGRLLAVLLSLGLIGAGFVGVIRAPNPRLGASLVSFATVRHPQLDEASGLVQSPSRPDVFWSHNDSGDRARLFALGADGRPLGPVAGIDVSSAVLQDWEDLTTMGGDLYVADVGNNFNNRQDLGVYQIPEPALAGESSVAATRFLPVRYPDQHRFPPLSGWNFDCEAIFSWHDKLYFITKSRPAFRVYIQGTSAGLYRLDSEHTDRVNVLTKVDQIDDLGGWVTAADTSRDGSLLAVLVESPVQSVWLFEQPAEGDRFFSEASSVRRFVFHGGGQLESLAFHSAEGETEEILLLNEARQLFRISLSDFTQP